MSCKHRRRDPRKEEKTNRRYDDQVPEHATSTTPMKKRMLEPKTESTFYRFCNDCDVDTHAINEWYMLRDEVWPAAVAGSCASAASRAALAAS
jgi:hypothetical protein